jgi:hypothetical protein
MLIFWITGNNNKAEPKSAATGETFRQHNEAVKRFRHAHPDLNVVSARDIVLADGDLLAPVHGVKLEENMRN